LNEEEEDVFAEDVRIADQVGLRNEPDKAIKSCPLFNITNHVLKQVIIRILMNSCTGFYNNFLSSFHSTVSSYRQDLHTTVK
jgi:hypothetical protein